MYLNNHINIKRKVNDNTMEMFEAIALRQSVRAYKEDQITETALENILKAACAAPVGRGKYENMLLTVVQNPEKLAQIKDACQGAMDDPNANPTYSAPTLIIVSTKLENDEIMPIGVANASCIVENMHLAATDLGLGSIFLFGFVRALNMQNQLGPMISLPKGWAPVAALGVGYAAEPLSQRKPVLGKIRTERI